MSTPSSQGATVSWNGSPLGRLTSFRASPGSGVYEEVTNVTSRVVGEGGNARIQKQYDCTAIEPGSLDIGVFGAPPFVLDQRGERGTVSLIFNGGSLFADAYLDNFDVSGQVGEFLVGTARFRLSGF
jgi:hypothetical protein